MSLKKKKAKISRRKAAISTPKSGSDSLDQLEELIISDGRKYFDHLIIDIQNSENFIDFESYAFAKDIIGDQIINALELALRRGVKVRVLVDGVGSPFWGSQCARRLEKAGAETKIFHPFPWQIWNWARSTSRAPWLWKWLYLAFNINTRNHRKTVVIDNKIAYISSFNVRRCHLPKDQGGDGWRDTAVRISGANLSTLNEAFDRVWHFRPINERMRDSFKHIRKNPIFRLNSSRHRRRILYKHLLRRIRKCRRRIWITNAYFLPDNFLLRRLKEAAKRGVDVRILLPKKSDIVVIPWATSTFYKSLLESGVRIFEYTPNMLHAKSIILDDWMLVGSSNLNSRSLRHDLEVDAQIQTAAAKKELERLFLADLQSSKEVFFMSWIKKSSIYKRILGKLVMYVKYWI